MSNSRKPPSASLRAARRAGAKAASDVGERIRRARDEAGLSQSELGEALGYKTSMISALENGQRKLKLEDLTRLCVILDKQPEYFLRTEAVRNADSRPVGLTLRAELAELPHEPLSTSIAAFLDHADAMPVLASRVPDLGYLKPQGAARQLLEICGIEKPPVRLKRVCKLLGLPLFYRPFPDSLSALIVEVEEGEYVIGVNEAHHENRRRFSLAHELGHAVLRHEAGHYLEVFDPEFGEVPNQRYGDEREANDFAANLLMDERWLREDWAGGMQSLPRLAKRYWVSAEAMSFRLVNLGLS